VGDVDTDLSERRARRWWQRRAPARTLARAAAFVDDVGFALVFPTRVSTPLPSLYEASSDRPLQNEGVGLDWSPDAERVWGWKDELPRRGLAWYGRFLRGRPSLLSPAMLADLYPRSGEPDDFRGAALDTDARRIAETILLSGPTSTALLREALDAYGSMGRARFDRALTQLGRALVVTHLGIEEQDAGWPAAILELTTRAFEVTGPADPAEARLRAARRFLDTMIRARPYELGNAFGWGADGARQAFGALVERGEAVRTGPAFGLGRPADGRG